MSPTLRNRIIKAASTLYRAANPRARRVTIVGIIRNGSRKRVYQCGVCRAQISMCTNYPMTVRVADFIRTHEQDCSAALCERNGVSIVETEEGR
jgi:hypothetical protein